MSSVAIMLAHHGCHVSMAELRRVSGIARDGIDGKGIVSLARHYGFEAKAFRREPGNMAALGFPLIAFTGLVHFTVVEGVSDTEVWLNDPNAGEIRQPLEDFAETFTGVVFQFRKGESAAQRPAPNVLRELLRNWLPNHRPLLTQITAAQAVATGLSLLSVFSFAHLFAHPSGKPPGAVATALMQWFEFSDQSVLAAMLPIAVAAAFGCYVIKGRLLDALELRLVNIQSVKLVQHALAQPFSFHSYRFSGHLHAQLLSAADIAASVRHNLIDSCLTGLHITALMLGLAWLSPVAAMCLLGAVTVVFVVQALRVSAYGDHRRALQARRQSPAGTQASIETLDTRRTAGMEDELIQSAIGSAAHQLELECDQFSDRAWRLSLETWLPLLLPAAVMALLTGTVGDASTSVNVATVVVASLCACLLPTLYDLPYQLPALRRKVLLIRDIESHVSRPESSNSSQLTDGRDLVVDRVSFGYASHKPPIIESLSLTIAAGEQLGLTGRSGSGKSTLVALLAGLHQPWRGLIIAGGCKLADMNQAQRGRCIAWVGKSGILFAGTIRDNLKLSDPKITESDLSNAVQDAGLTDVLAARIGGIDAIVEERGRNFSGGQRQRLELARALARNPKIIVLDEALEAIEPALEAEIRNALRQRGCTVLVVSHRASSLATCDRVVHMQRGQLADEPEVAPRPPTQIPMHSANPAEASLNLDAGQAQRLCRVGAAMAQYAGLHIRAVDPAQQLAAAEPGIEQWARTAGLRRYRMRFTRNDRWQVDHGPLLAITTDTREPVFLRPASSPKPSVGPHSAYRWTDADCTDRPLKQQLMQRLGHSAFALLPPADPSTTRLFAFFRSVGANAAHGIRGAGMATVGASAALVMLTVLLGSIPITAKELTRPDQLLLTGTVLCLFTAWVCLDRTALTMFARARADLLPKIAAASWERLLSIRPASLRSAPASQVAERVFAPQALLQAFDIDSLHSAASSLIWVPAALALWLIWPTEPQSMSIAALLLPGVLLVASLAMAFSDRTLHQRLRARQQTQRQLLLDLLRGIGPLRAIDATSELASRWQAAFAQHLQLEHQLRRNTRLGKVFQNNWPLLACVCVLGWAGLPTTTVEGAGLESSRVMPAALTWLAVLLGTSAVVAAGIKLAENMGLIGAARNLLAMPVATTNPTHDLPPPSGHIDVRDVRFEYSELAAPVLDGVSLSINPGDVVALVGASGSGKSTLLRLIAGLDQASGGQICYGETLLSPDNAQAIRPWIGLVTQEDQTTPTTIRHNIAGRSARDLAAVWHAAKLAGIDQEIAAMPMNMQTIVDEHVVSSGQKQRLFIAARLLRQPRILLLDESTSVLHESLQAQLFENIRALGLTCVFATHRASAVKHADKAYLFDSGRVVASGGLDDLHAAAPQLGLSDDGADSGGTKHAESH